MGSEFPEQPDTANLQNLQLDKDLYRKITRISYAEHISIPKIINDMLKEHINVYLLWRKVGYILVSKEVVRKALSYMADEEIVATAENIADRIREAAIILYGKPNLDAYVSLMKSFAAVNGFDIEKGKGANGTTEILIVQFRMNEKYSKFLGNAFKLLIGEFADLVNFYTTDNLSFIEYAARVRRDG
jgi:hypothetical protein